MNFAEIGPYFLFVAVAYQALRDIRLGHDLLAGFCPLGSREGQHAGLCSHSGHDLLGHPHPTILPQGPVYGEGPSGTLTTDPQVLPQVCEMIHEAVGKCIVTLALVSGHAGD